MAEGSRWYTRDGTLAPSQVEKKTKPGEFRTTTLRDAREMGWFPSVSTILRTAANPSIEAWVKEQVIAAALEHPATVSMAYGLVNQPATPTEWARYVGEVLVAADARREQAAATGTEVHAFLQRSLENKELPTLSDELQQTALAMLDAFWHLIGDPEGDQVHIDTEASFVHTELGYAGTPDVLIQIGSAQYVVDWKTQGFGDGRKVRFYDSWRRQIAAYSYGIHRRATHCAVICGSTVEPGRVETKLYTIPEVRAGWDEFEHLRAFWQLANGYNPSLSAAERAA